MCWCLIYYCFFFKQKTAYEMRISDWSSDVCSSDLLDARHLAVRRIIGVIGAVAAFVDRVIGLVALFGIGAGRVVGRGLDDRGQARARFGDMPFLGHIAARVIGPLDIIAFGEGLTRPAR